MTSRITTLLSKGIAYLTAGGAADEYLEQAELKRLPPDEQQELRALLDLAASLLQLRQVAVPAPKAKAINRTRFLSEAVRLQEARQAAKPLLGLHGWPMLRQLWRPLLGAALTLALLLAMGRGAMQVTAGSLPGSPLYPLKLVVEDTHLALAPSPATRAQLYLRFASERTVELARLATAGRPVDEIVVARMAQQMEGAVQAAESAGGETARQLLAQVIQTSNEHQEVLRQASAQAVPEAQPVLEAGMTVAQQAARQAQELLQRLPPPTATPAPTLTNTPTSVPVRPPAIGPVKTATSTAAPGHTAAPARPTHTSTAPRTPGAMPKWSRTPLFTPELTKTASATPEDTATPSATPEDTATPSATPTQTPTYTPRPTRTPSATPEPTASATPEPTRTPQAVFSLTNTDRPDPVPATHRIHYDICVRNEGEVPLTNVVIVDRWSPPECVYLPPDNPTEKVWSIGTVSPHTSYCVHFTLNTFSVCVGRTVTNEAVMTCEQGTASAVQTTRIGPTPPMTATPTLTPTATATLTMTLSALSSD